MRLEYKLRVGVRGIGSFFVASRHALGTILSNTLRNAKLPTRGEPKVVSCTWKCRTEAQNSAREFFGSERLRTSLGWVGEDAHPHELIRRVRDDVHRFAGDAEPADDLTLLAIRWNGRAEAA